MTHGSSDAGLPPGNTVATEPNSATSAAASGSVVATAKRSRWRAAYSVLAWGQCAALCAWLYDEVGLARYAVLDGLFASGAAAGLFLSALVAALVAIPLAAVWATRTREPVWRFWALLAKAAKGTWAYLSPQDAATRTRHSASIVSGLLITAAALVCSTLATRETLIHVVRPINAALVVATAHLGFAVAALVLWPALHTWMRFLIHHFGRIPGLGVPARTPRRIAAGVLLSVLVATGVGAYLLRFALPYLPFDHVLFGVVTLLGSLLLVFLVALVARIRALGWIVRVAWVATLGFGLYSGIKLGPESGGALDAMSRGTHLGKLGHALLVAAFDFDRDGHLNGFGGRDCDGSNPRIYAGAVDIPGNDVDENCDGEDLSTRELKDIRGRLMSD